MNDERSEFSGLEADLRQFSPGVSAENLPERIAVKLDTAPIRPWADRCLMGAIGMGLAASIVVAVTLGSDLLAARHHEPAANVDAQTTIITQTREYLAQLALAADRASALPSTAPH